MKRKNMFTSAIIIITLALSIGLSGCGKQDVAPVMAATIETLTSEVTVTTEEESVIATEEETESIQESSTDETETESIQESEIDEIETESTTQDNTITEINKEVQQQQQQEPQVQTPPPAENPQPPVVNPPEDNSPAKTLPDGGFVTDDGTEIHPGFTDEYGNTYMGNGDSLFDGYW